MYPLHLAGQDVKAGGWPERRLALPLKWNEQQRIPDIAWRQHAGWEALAG